MVFYVALLISGVCCLATYCSDTCVSSIGDPPKIGGFPLVPLNPHERGTNSQKKTLKARIFDSAGLNIDENLEVAARRMHFRDVVPERINVEPSAPSSKRKQDMDRRLQSLPLLFFFYQGNPFLVG